MVIILRDSWLIYDDLLTNLQTFRRPKILNNFINFSYDQGY